MVLQGSRVKLAALGVLLALAIAAVVFFRAHSEEWCLQRFRTGDERTKAAAARWMEENGSEQSLVALTELSLDLWPETLLAKSLRWNPVDNLGPVARASFTMKMEDLAHRMVLAGVASGRIEARLGMERLGQVSRALLSGETEPTRAVVVLFARHAIAQAEAIGLGPESRDLAVRRLVEALADADPYVRGGAVYGLSEAGSRATEYLEAIEALRDDASDLVREAVAHGRAAVGLPASWLEFRLAEAAPGPGLARFFRSDQPCYLHPEVLATGRDIESAAVHDDEDGKTAVEFTLGGAGRERIARATAENPGGVLAILYEGNVIVTGAIRSPILGRGVLTTFTRRQAAHLASALAAR